MPDSLPIPPHTARRLLERGSCEVALGAIPYRAAWSEGQVVFRHVHGFYGHNARIVITKPAGLLHVSIEDNLSGAIPVSHITKAAELAEDILGPNHFESHEAKRQYEKRLPLVRITHFGPWWGWRSGLVQVRGKHVLAWGEARRKRPTSLIERAFHQRSRDDVDD